MVYIRIIRHAKNYYHHYIISGGGGLRARTCLAPVPVWSSTVVHSHTVLVAKPDLASQSIRRLDLNRGGFCLVRLCGLSPSQGLRPRTPGWAASLALYRGCRPRTPAGFAVCGGFVYKTNFCRPPSELRRGFIPPRGGRGYLPRSGNRIHNPRSHLSPQKAAVSLIVNA